MNRKAEDDGGRYRTLAEVYRRFYRSGNIMLSGEPGPSLTVSEIIEYVRIEAENFVVLQVTEETGVK